MIKIVLVSLVTVLALGCGRTPTVKGNVDESKVITNEKISTMSWKDISKKYLGKVITLTNIVSSNYTHKISSGQCNHSYRLLDASGEKLNKILVSIPFNYDLNDIKYLQNVKSPLGLLQKVDVGKSEKVFFPESELCAEKKCSFDDGRPERCSWASPQFKITGRVVMVNPKPAPGTTTVRDVVLLLQPQGFAY